MTLRLFAEFHHSGDHEAAWRLPTAQPERIADAGYYVERARLAARGGFDAVFFADFPGFDPAVRHHIRWPFEPTVLLGAVAAAVPDVRLVATASTVFSTADRLVDTFAALQRVSGGRAGWNVVTAGSPTAARALGIDALPPHDERYDAADAVVADFRERWDPDVPRPLLVQAGASDRGREFAARHADVVFAATPTLADGRAFRDDLHRRAATYGRPPPLLLPGFLVTLGSTVDEARRLRTRLDDLLTDPNLAGLLRGFGIEPPAAGLDAPLPADLADPSFGGIRSRAPVLAAIAARLGPSTSLRTLARHVAGSRGHLQHAGTPEEIATIMGEWHAAGAADGFVVKFSHNPGGAEDFVDGVVPVLRHRGLLRPRDVGTPVPTAGW
ncbi:LLM class flavin-dependent oxidoreductase [Pseudonocardia endophytica]|uniref:Alkanesulfonate monooxygenase SsuD/methylene tetrahydromethanopterin reductase-like flavin-dependent oxidoreductase (Luciferase family) n=1 Tax=Pseudonocardia endophytica TaxID=401976 RepID=A0A4R1HWZ5_PSEEN|nr:LLM class flavin-dependent oxidoreductase [Pseudonocardia endophytica]TCK22062.1 alkanesulfonate monooxygenase SsuD/methylene tetrahydromethanopterin reductase-like flavin-dependent oxidoreductase (luciferase family) [Pseudonocardia endophytica]